MDEQEKIQKAHLLPTPRIGGLGIFLASLFVFYEGKIGGLLALSAIPAFIAGFIEDYSGKVSPLTRLAIMALSPLMAVVMVQDAGWGLLLGSSVPEALTVCLLFLFIVAIINGMNFIDGQNGLASGSAVIALAGISYLAYGVQDASLLFICLVFLCSITAFLFFNFPFGRIFLGDGGAYFLGFLLAVLALLLLLRHPSLPPVFLFVLVAYPLTEVCFSSIRKLLVDRISPFNSDDDHLHQLVYRNHAQGRPFLPALLLLPVQAALLFLAIAFIHRPEILWLLLFGFVGVYCFVYFCERKLDHARKARVSLDE